MAKEGMPSFLLDCRTNDNISEIEAEYGVKGFAVVVRLWQKIYAEKGYYCEWIERSPLLFLSNWFGGNSGVTVSLINEIVKRCLNNGIFNAGMYENYSILTSERIQEQYFSAVKRREQILAKKEYLLVSVDKIRGIVYENSISAYKNQKNVCRNDTREGKVSKGKVSKDRECVQRIEEFIFNYPKGCNRHLTEIAYCDLVMDGVETEDNLVACANNYAESCRILETPERYIKNAENFLKEFVFEKYLPERYKKPTPDGQKKGKSNQFNQFQQNKYDFEKLESEILSN